MLFIIDGYNLIKTVFKKPYVSTKEIDTCISIIAYYISKKQYTAIIVFDGFNNLSYKYNPEISIIYSELKSADDYIKDYIKNYINNNNSNTKAKDLLIVTSDQEIVKFAYRLSIDSIDSYSFYHQINKNYIKNKHKNISNKINRPENTDGQIHKLNDQEDLELDSLMKQACKKMIYKDQDYQNNNQINNNQNKKLSKKKLKILKKI
ncbi:MAG: NYN domain-containing protein [Novosphingobium sp.]|nr:NYN domain-containing protein [Novosphingobium sp.]